MSKNVFLILFLARGTNKR